MSRSHRKEGARPEAGRLVETGHVVGSVVQLSGTGLEQTAGGAWTGHTAQVWGAGEEGDPGDTGGESE